MSKKRKIVLVKWIDSIQTPGWGGKLKSNMDCQTAGFLVEKTKDYILVALNMSAYTDGDHVQIPMISVRSVKVVGTTEQPDDGVN